MFSGPCAQAEANRNSKMGKQSPMAIVRCVGKFHLLVEIASSVQRACKHAERFARTKSQGVSSAFEILNKNILAVKFALNPLNPCWHASV
jgi:hypothetical protein